MKNWKILNQEEYNLSWNYLYNSLHFQPYADRQNVISFPMPCECFDIAAFYNNEFNEELYEDLHTSALSWFRFISKGTRMFALNWQHDCYSFTSELPFEKDEFNEWLIPLFPNGDYLFFLTNDFKNGIFADGISLSISFFGSEIKKALRTKRAKILTKEIPCM